MNTRWPNVRLGEVLRLYDTSVIASQLDEVNLAGVYSFARGLFKRGPMSPAKTSYKTYNRLVADDFVISQPKAWEGALARVTTEFEGWYLSPVFPTFRANRERLEPAFLEWFCKQKTVWEDLQQNSRGIGARRETVSPEQFLLLQIPLPPVAEQQRIVARFEELAAKIQETRLLRQQAAEEGDSLVNAQLRATSELLAQRHGITRLEKLIAEAGYGSSEKCSPERDDGAVPVLRIPNVASEKIELNDLKFAHLSAREGERLLLASGDILVVRTNGSLELVGRSAVVDELPEPMAFASYMIRLRFDTAAIYPAYAQKMLRHLRVSGQLIDFARTTAGQYNVSLGRLRSAEIPVPPLAEQRTIVAHIDELQGVIDTLRAYQSGTSEELDALMPSILDKAFRGEF